MKITVIVILLLAKELAKKQLVSPCWRRKPRTILLCASLARTPILCCRLCSNSRSNTVTGSPSYLRPLPWTMARNSLVLLSLRTGETRCSLPTHITSLECPQNERHNGLFRAFIRKVASIKEYSPEDILYAADKLNEQPSKKLG